MHVIEPGHIYGLRLLDDSINHNSVIQFVKRVGDRYPGNAHPEHSGTTCQEVLRALIDRIEFLNRQIPCVEMEAAIGNLRTTLLLFEIRAARVHNRVIDALSIHEFEHLTPCPHCLHVGCKGST
jgi:hypothetical protein